MIFRNWYFLPGQMVEDPDDYLSDVRRLFAGMAVCLHRENGEEVVDYFC
jgi:hypothetical protein